MKNERKLPLMTDTQLFILIVTLLAIPLTVMNLIPMCRDELQSYQALGVDTASKHFYMCNYPTSCTVVSWVFMPVQTLIAAAGNYWYVTPIVC